MPIYDYECTQCRHRFELRQGFNDDPLSTCPLCQGPVRRLFHAVGVIYKGTGWYVTDYARKGSGAGDKDKDKAKESSED